MNKVILFDLEQNMPTATVLRELLQHYHTVYLFNCQGKFEYALEDLTEFASWLNSGQVIVLDVPQVEHQEYAYAVVVGQLLALLEAETQIEVISAMSSIEVLLQLMQGAGLFASLIQLESQTESASSASSYRLPSAQAFQRKPALQLVKKYCDALGEMAGKPGTIEGLKNSISNILHVLPEQAQQLLGMLIKLKIVKRYDQQVSYRKKILKQWLQLKLDHLLQEKVVDVQEKNAKSPAESSSVKSFPSVQALLQAQQSARQEQPDAVQIDALQWEMVRALSQLKTEKPKDIFELRDLLEKLYPEADVKLLLKELLEKGYIYWNGHEVLYSYELSLN